MKTSTQDKIHRLSQTLLVSLNALEALEGVKIKKIALVNVHLPDGTIERKLIARGKSK